MQEQHQSTPLFPQGSWQDAAFQQLKAAGHTRCDADRLRALVTLLPKTDLHCHLDGSIRPATIAELADRYQVPLPCPLSELTEHLTVGPGGVQDFLKFALCFDIPISVMQTPDALSRCAYELVEQAALDGAVAIEARFAPALHQSRANKLSYDAIMDAVIDGLMRGRKQFGIATGVIAGIYRNLELQHLDFDTGTQTHHARPTAEAVVRACRRHPDFPVALDIVGKESGFPLSDPLFAECYQYVHRHQHPAETPNLHLVAHAGEMPGTAFNILTAVQQLHITRIGHGIQYFALDPDSRPEAIHHTAFELCATSNLQLQVWPDLSDYPIYRFLKQGIPVTINTDNRTVNRTTLTDEWLKLLNPEAGFPLFDSAQKAAQNAAQKLSPQVRTLITRGISCSFAPDAEKQRMLHRAAQLMDALDSVLVCPES